MQCFKVKCVEVGGVEHEVGVMCSDENAAKHCAENSLFEGKHIKAKAIEVVKTNAI